MKQLIGQIFHRKMTGRICHGKMTGTVKHITAPPVDPVAYLYNGVELPALPGWDKETYPYAAVIKFTNGTIPLEIRFLVSTSPMVNTAGNMVKTEKPCVRWSYGEAEWTDKTEHPDTGDGTVIVTMSGAIWANHDILKNDGTVYLAASEPVPVYE